MDKIKKVLDKAGWVVALALALYLFVTDYIATNPFPADPSVQTEQVTE